MANFMGPMAPPQAAPQQPPQMDVRTSPNQRAQFKNFMSNIGMGVPPLSLAPPIPQVPSPMMPTSPMMNVDIFQPQSFYAGGPVGGGADAGQMAADAFSGKPDGQQSGPSVGIGPSERVDALSDILNATPVPNMNFPQQQVMDTLNVPSPVQNVVNMATKGVSIPGPMGIGSVNIAPDFSDLLGGDLGIGATYAVNFFNGGEVDGRERGIAAGAMGGAGPAADPDGVGGTGSGEGADKGIDVTATTGQAQSEFQSDLKDAFEEANKTVQIKDAGFESMDQYNDYVSGLQKTADIMDSITSFAPVVGGIKKAADFFGFDIFGDEETISNKGQAKVDEVIGMGGTYNPETNSMSYSVPGGTVNVNSFGLSTYTGSGPDPFAQQIDETSIGGAERISPVLAEEAKVDPCPPGFELKDGVCKPVASNQIGGMPLPSPPSIMPVPMPSPIMGPISTPENDLSLPPPVSPPVLVPSTRPAVGALRGPATFNPNAMLTPEFFQNLLTPAPRPIGMKDGGSVLDAAADQFLMGLRAA